MEKRNRNYQGGFLLTINLKKGQRIDLTKGNTGLRTLKIGLGWDEVGTKTGSFLKNLFKSSGPSVDCDASVLMLNEKGKLGRQQDLVYYGNLKHPSNGVRHMGDNLTGEGEGDDEEIFVELPNVPPHHQRLLFVVNIYDCRSRNQDFGLIHNAFIRVVDNVSNRELARYNLSEDYAGKTTLTVGEVYRQDQDWKFVAIGEGTTDTSIEDVIKRYR